MSDLRTKAGRNTGESRSFDVRFVTLLAYCRTDDSPTCNCTKFQGQSVTDVVQCRLHIRPALSMACLKKVLTTIVLCPIVG
jgi:hypothetical protein